MKYKYTILKTLTELSHDKHSFKSNLLLMINRYNKICRNKLIRRLEKNFDYDVITTIKNECGNIDLLNQGYISEYDFTILITVLDFSFNQVKKLYPDDAKKFDESFLAESAYMMIINRFEKREHDLIMGAIISFLKSGHYISGIYVTINHLICEYDLVKECNNEKC